MKIVFCYTENKVFYSFLLYKAKKGGMNQRMTKSRMDWNSMALVAIGILLLLVWLSFIDRAVRHPFPFIIAGLSILLLVTKKWSNLIFHMVGVLLFACLLVYIEYFDDYPLRFTVVGLAVILMTTHDSNRKSPAFYKRLKERREKRKRRDHEK